MGVKRGNFPAELSSHKRSHAVAIKPRVKKGKRLLFHNASKGLFPCNKIIINVTVNLKLERGRVNNYSS